MFAMEREKTTNDAIKCSHHFLLSDAQPDFFQDFPPRFFAYCTMIAYDHSNDFIFVQKYFITYSFLFGIFTRI